MTDGQPRMRYAAVALRMVAGCVLAISATGCGTIHTRVPTDGYAPFGAYPYQSLCYDGLMLEKLASNFGEAPVILDVAGFAILPGSVVLDTALDTVSLPVDLACWLFGKHKRPNQEPGW